MPGGFAALATALLVVGTLLLVSPIDQGRVSSTKMDSGTWLEVPVPASTSWTGSSVEVQLSWGTVDPPSSCTGYCPSRFGTSPANLTYLLVFDCGRASCASDGNYSVVGTTAQATGGSTGFVATPGHFYQVWLLVAPNDLPVPSTPVRYALETPIANGFFGAALIALGVSVALESARRWRRRANQAPLPHAYL
jgi:hypothetical protein